MRSFQNKVQRTMFGPKRNNETGGWRILHRNIIRVIKSVRDEMVSSCRTHGRDESCMQYFCLKI
jgi:hypothetical protein